MSEEKQYLEFVKNIYDSNGKKQKQFIDKNDYSKIFINKFLESFHWKKILDIWCGSGKDMITFGNHWYDVVWIDISWEMLSLCQEAWIQKDKLILWDAEVTKNFPTDSFDGVRAMASFVNITKEYNKKVWEDIYRILKKWWIFFVSLKKQKRWEPEEINKESFSVSNTQKRYIYYKKSEVSKIFKNIGFEEIYFSQSYYKNRDNWLCFIFKKNI